MGGAAMSYDPKLLFEQISVCLNENPRKTLEELAQSLRVSKRTIKKTVRSLTGGNFRHYREEVLMERVKGFFAMQRGAASVRRVPRRIAHLCRGRSSGSGKTCDILLRIECERSRSSQTAKEMLRRRVDLPTRPFSSELECSQTAHRDCDSRNLLINQQRRRA